MNLFCFVNSTRGCKFYFHDKRELHLKKLKYLGLHGLTAVACSQGLQVMLCMSKELLCDDLIFLLNKEYPSFGTELEKSEADPR